MWNQTLSIHPIDQVVKLSEKTSYTIIYVSLSRIHIVHTCEYLVHMGVSSQNRATPTCQVSINPARGAHDTLNSLAAPHQAFQTPPSPKADAKSDRDFIGANENWRKNLENL